jgi:hypothetical protein
MYISGNTQQDRKIPLQWALHDTRLEFGGLKNYPEPWFHHMEFEPFISHIEAKVFEFHLRKFYCLILKIKDAIRFIIEVKHNYIDILEYLISRIKEPKFPYQV